MSVLIDNIMSWVILLSMMGRESRNYSWWSCWGAPPYWCGCSPYSVASLRLCSERLFSPSSRKTQHGFWGSSSAQISLPLVSAYPWLGATFMSVRGMHNSQVFEEWPALTPKIVVDQVPSNFGWKVGVIGWFNIYRCIVMHMTSKSSCNIANNFGLCTCNRTLHINNRRLLFNSNIVFACEVLGR